MIVCLSVCIYVFVGISSITYSVYVCMMLLYHNSILIIHCLPIIRLWSSFQTPNSTCKALSRPRGNPYIASRTFCSHTWTASRPWSPITTPHISDYLNQFISFLLLMNGCDHDDVVYNNVGLNYLIQMANMELDWFIISYKKPQW